MEYILVEISKWTTVFAFVFPRLLAVFMFLPFFAKETLSSLGRGGIVASIAMIMVPTIEVQYKAGDFDFTKFLFMLPKEILIGSLIGFILSLPFQFGSVAGKIIDLQRGDSISSTYDPMLKSNDSSLARMLNQGQFVIFFASGAFFFAIQAIYDSYVVWPVHEFIPEFDLADAISVGEIFQNVLYMSVLLAAPVFLCILVVDITMGFISRFVSNLQVFIVAFPIKGMLAGIVLVLYVTVMIDILEGELLKSGIVLEVVKNIL